MFSISEEARNWIFDAFAVVNDKLVWARDGSRGVKAGDEVAAFINSTGYYCVKVNTKPRKTMLLHRVKWLVAYGEYPDCDVDHINRNHLDNSLKNLRLATRSQNRMNSVKKARDNGLPLGVYRHGDKFCSSISKGRNRKFLGVFASPDDAHNAWLKASKDLYGDFAPCHT